MDVIFQQFQPRLGVIMATSAVNNNAVRDGFVRLRKDNEVVRTFVNSYSPPADPDAGVQNLVLMDWEKLTDALIVANAEMQSIPAERAFNHYVTGEAVPEAHMYSPEGNRYFFPQLTAMACAGTAELTDENRVGTCPAHKRGLGESFAIRILEGSSIFGSLLDVTLTCFMSFSIETSSYCSFARRHAFLQ
jgi:hypothetical protein